MHLSLVRPNIFKILPLFLCVGSVEHYAYQRLFEALKLPEEEVMKIRTTVKPVDVAKCAKRLFEHLKVYIFFKYFSSL
jgi:hypothetical protein